MVGVTGSAEVGVDAGAEERLDVVGVGSGEVSAVLADSAVPGALWMLFSSSSSSESERSPLWTRGLGGTIVTFGWVL